MKYLDPSLRQFIYPDFGYDDALNIDGKISSVWTLLADHISLYPKYERLKNYIQELTLEKHEMIQKEANKNQKKYQQ
jgi:hypothetical protein